MAFFNKLGDIAKSIGDKAGDAIETTKLNGKINAEKAAIGERMRQIGEYYYEKYLAGAAVDPGAAELFAAIDAHNKAIADTQTEIARIQAENAAQAAAAGAPAAGAPAAPMSPAMAAAAAPMFAPAMAAAGTACPACGTPNAPGVKFCAECGGKIEPPAPAPEPAAENRACPGCGANLPAGNRFCGECGYKFEYMEE